MYLITVLKAMRYSIGLFSIRFIFCLLDSDFHTIKPSRGSRYQSRFFGTANRLLNRQPTYKLRTDRKETVVPMSVPKNTGTNATQIFN